MSKRLKEMVVHLQESVKSIVSINNNKKISLSVVNLLFLRFVLGWSSGEIQCNGHQTGPEV